MQNDTADEGSENVSLLKTDSETHTKPRSEQWLISLSNQNVFCLPPWHQIVLIGQRGSPHLIHTSLLLNTAEDMLVLSLLLLKNAKHWCLWGYQRSQRKKFLNKQIVERKSAACFFFSFLNSQPRLSQNNSHIHTSLKHAAILKYVTHNTHTCDYSKACCKSCDSEQQFWMDNELYIIKLYEYAHWRYI